MEYLYLGQSADVMVPMCNNGFICGGIHECADVGCGTHWCNMAACNRVHHCDCFGSIGAVFAFAT